MRRIPLIVVGLCLSVLFGSQALATSEATNPAASEELTHLLTEAPNDRTVGSVEAPHTLIVYASNTCPHCGQWFTQDWPIIKRDLVETGKLRFVFRAFPTQPVQLSLTGFLMAECAPPEDYMSVMEDQFARQSAILSAPDGEALRVQYDAIAQNAGLNDPAAVTECLENDANYRALQRLSLKAQASDIRGVPAFIFDEQIMRGAHDAASVKGWVEGRSSRP